MLLQEAGREATGLQRQLCQQRTTGHQTGQGLRHAVAQRVHTEVELLQALRGETRSSVRSLNYIHIEMVDEKNAASWKIECVAGGLVWVREKRITNSVNPHWVELRLTSKISVHH